MGSRTSPFCLGPTDALRTGDVQRLAAGLARYVASSEPTLHLDVRDVLVGLAPYYDCAQRPGLDPVQVFDAAGAAAGDAMRATLWTFARRTDVTLANFGWVLLQRGGGPCYRPDGG